MRLPWAAFLVAAGLLALVGFLPYAADYRGDVLAAMNHFDSADRVMTAAVPARGVSTLYALVGDVFAWLAALCLLALTALALLRPERTAEYPAVL